jgi:hypothetical protein
MKTWNYAVNSLAEYKERSSIQLVEQPWWLAFIEWTTWNVFMRICDVLNYIGVEEWWHLSVCNSITNWVENHPKHKVNTFEVGYDAIKEHFYEDNQKFFDELEKN